MLEINRLRAEAKDFAELLKVRNKDFARAMEQVLTLDQEKRQIQTALDELLARANQIAKEVGAMFKAGKKEEAEGLKAEAAELKVKTAELKEQMQEKETTMNDVLYSIPNVPNKLVPPGNSDEDNLTVFENNFAIDLGDQKDAHWDLIKSYDIVDFELGNKVTGAGFPFYKGAGAKLQRALINYFLNFNADAGYLEYIPPFFVNEASGRATGQLPDKEGQMYHMQLDDLYAIPTAEVPVTNIYRDVMVKKEELPIKMTAYSPCFRREAGSWGAHVRGLNRLHQFEKVEIVQITKQEDSYDALDSMVEHVKALMESLNLPYRILRLCGGDLGFTSALTYDFEVWSAAQERWLEVSSVSNFETYQANRLKLRYKNEEGKSVLAHTLNGSALALPRIMAAILENNQTAEGIKVPAVLQPFMGMEMIKK